MSDRSRLMTAIREGILQGEADLPRDDREAAFRRAFVVARGGHDDAPAMPEPLRAFVEKVAGASYKVLDEDFDALTEAGFSDEAIFAAVAATAAGAGLARLEIGLEAMGRAG